MPRFRLNLSSFAVTLIALVPWSASAQDAKTIAPDAEKRRPDIQKQLATGELVKGKKNPDLSRLRLDKFEAKGDQVHVTGVFLDPGTEPGESGYSAAFESVQNDLKKFLGAENIGFNWSGITEVGAIDKDKKPKTKFAPPHILVQQAANAAGAKGQAAADRILLTGSDFGPDGELRLLGSAAEADTWLKGDGEKALEGHPAARVKDGKPQVNYTGLTQVKAPDWKVSADAIQARFATAGKPDSKDDKEKQQYALRRLRVERAYFFYDQNELKFRVEGVRIGKDAVEAAWVSDDLLPLLTGVVGRPTGGEYGSLVGTQIDEPVTELRTAVAATPALDGVRIDPGFMFGPKGEVVLAGIQPGLPAVEQGKIEAELAPLVKMAFRAASAGKTPDVIAKYEKVGASPVLVKSMTALPLAKLKATLRQWAAQKEDLKIGRLYFPDQLGTLDKQHHVVNTGLVLLYYPSHPDHIKAVEAAFKIQLEALVPDGIPAAPDAGKTADAQPMHPKTVMPSLTAYLRKEMSDDQKTWYGVLIERGYFDPETNRYTIAGVVDTADQNAKLDKLIQSLSTDPKWKEYFEQPHVTPNLKPIPMSELLDRVMKVTPAYAAFDGVRITNARYEFSKGAKTFDELKLVFEAHTAGTVDPAALTKLRELLEGHDDYRRRLPPSKVVLIRQVSGPKYADDQVGNFSIAYGAKLLSKAGASKEDTEKAKTWLDIAMLHYPNESAVWFLSAYYNFVIVKDDELTRRDLFRVIELEGPLAFNGPAQRKRRYENAKELQGSIRHDLEALWLECFRDVKDGAKPITLTKPKK